MCARGRWKGDAARVEAVGVALEGPCGDGAAAETAELGVEHSASESVAPAYGAQQLA